MPDKHDAGWFLAQAREILAVIGFPEENHKGFTHLLFWNTKGGWGEEIYEAERSESWCEFIRDGIAARYIRDYLREKLRGKGVHVHTDDYGNMSMKRVDLEMGTCEYLFLSLFEGDKAEWIDLDDKTAYQSRRPPRPTEFDTEYEALIAAARAVFMGGA